MTISLVAILITTFLLSSCGDKIEYPDWTPKIDFEPPADYQVTIFEAQEPQQASQKRLDNPRPNIIFVLTDDQPPQTVAYMPTVKNVLMAEGVNFENGFLTKSSSGPIFLLSTAKSLRKELRASVSEESPQNRAAIFSRA